MFLPIFAGSKGNCTVFPMIAKFPQFFFSTFFLNDIRQILGTASTHIHMTVNSHTPESQHYPLLLRILREFYYRREGVKHALKNRVGFICSYISITLASSRTGRVTSPGIRAWPRA